MMKNSKDNHTVSRVDATTTFETIENLLKENIELCDAYFNICREYRDARDFQIFMRDLMSITFNSPRNQSLLLMPDINRETATRFFLERKMEFVKMQESLQFINDQLNNSENKREDVEAEIGLLYYIVKSAEDSSTNYNQFLLTTLETKAKKLTYKSNRNLQITIPDSWYTWYNQSLYAINWPIKPASTSVRYRNICIKHRQAGRICHYL